MPVCAYISSVWCTEDTINYLLMSAHTIHAHTTHTEWADCCSLRADSIVRILQISIYLYY